MSKDDSPPSDAAPPSDSDIRYEVKRYTFHTVPLDLFKLCRGLSRQTADQSTMKPDAVTFVLYRNDVPVGFATVYDPGARMRRIDEASEIPGWRDYDTKSLHLDVFCTNLNQEGFGTRILKEVEAYARSQGKTRLELLSLPGAVGFYTKNGFKPITDSMAGLDLEKTLSGGRRKTRRRRSAFSRRRIRR